VFANDGTGTFQDVSRQNRPFCGTARVSRGLACGVLNPRRSGSLDLLVTTVAGPARLYRNVAPGRGHWLLVRALVKSPADPTKERDAYGATVTVRAGKRSWVGLINP